MFPEPCSASLVLQLKQPKFTKTPAANYTGEDPATNKGVAGVERIKVNLMEAKNGWMIAGRSLWIRSHREVALQYPRVHGRFLDASVAIVSVPGGCDNDGLHPHIYTAAGVVSGITCTYSPRRVDTCSE